MKEQAMKCEYETVHHNDGRQCERVPVIPAHWELSDEKYARAGDRFERDGEWVLLPEHSTTHFLIGCEPRIIRPKKPAVRLEIGAWYEVEGDGVHQCVMSQAALPGVEEFSIGGGFYNADGKPVGGFIKRIVRRVHVAPYDTLGDSLLAAVKARTTGATHHEFGTPNGNRIYCMTHNVLFDCPACKAPPCECVGQSLCGHCVDRIYQKAMDQRNARDGQPSAQVCPLHGYMFTPPNVCSWCTMEPVGRERWWEGPVKCICTGGEYSNQCKIHGSTFRMSGPGWYKTTAGDWIRMTKDRIDHFRSLRIDVGNNTAAPNKVLAFVAKAAPEQVRVLEGL